MAIPQVCSLKNRLVDGGLTAAQADELIALGLRGVVLRPWDPAHASIRSYDLEIENYRHAYVDVDWEQGGISRWFQKVKEALEQNRECVAQAKAKVEAKAVEKLQKDVSKLEARIEELNHQEAAKKAHATFKGFVAKEKPRYYPDLPVLYEPPQILQSYGELSALTADLKVESSKSWSTSSVENPYLGYPKVLVEPNPAVTITINTQPTPEPEMTIFGEPEAADPVVDPPTPKKPRRYIEEDRRLLDFEV